MKINVGGSFLRFRNFNGNNLIRALAKFTKIDSIHFQNIELRFSIQSPHFFAFSRRYFLSQKTINVHGFDQKKYFVSEYKYKLLKAGV